MRAVHRGRYRSARRGSFPGLRASRATACPAPSLGARSSRSSSWVPPAVRRARWWNRPRAPACACAPSPSRHRGPSHPRCAALRLRGDRRRHRSLGPAQRPGGAPRQRARPARRAGPGARLQSDPPRAVDRHRRRPQPLRPRRGDLPRGAAAALGARHRLVRGGGAGRGARRRDLDRTQARALPGLARRRLGADRHHLAGHQPPGRRRRGAVDRHLDRPLRVSERHRHSARPRARLRSHVGPLRRGRAGRPAGRGRRECGAPPAGRGRLR